MILFSNSKINLGLFVKEKRQDGYHNIETVFYPVDLCDALEIMPGKNKAASLTVSGNTIPSGVDQNLCMRAYHLIKNNFDIAGVDMHLLKKIPIGTGLGGGSANAAFTLIALNNIFKLNLNEHQLSDLARELGSDCAFFIKNTPCFAHGKGDILEPIDLALNPYFMVIVIPDINVSTAMAYQKTVSHKNRESIRNIIQLPIENWRFELYNDFEYPIFELYPQIAGIKERLYKLGAVYASMSGTGSAVYGIFKDKVCLKKNFKKHFVWQGVCKI